MKQLPPLTPDDFGIPRQPSFTTGELARIFRVSEDSIRSLVRRGVIAGERAGRGITIAYEEVVRYFERQQQARAVTRR